MGKREDAMLRSICEQPDLIRNIYKNHGTICAPFVELFRSASIKKVYFSGQASGIFIGNMLKPFMERLLEVEAVVTNPSCFLQHEGFNVNHMYRPEEMVMLCPAHSGSTVGPIRMAAQCKKLGIPVVCTTYDVQSELASLSTVVMYKMSDAETSFIETKGHMASLAVFFLCIIETARVLGKITREEYDRYCGYFEKVPPVMEQIIKDTQVWYAKHKYMLLSSGSARYVGFGSYYFAAQEGGLKIAEATPICSLPYELEEFMHTSTTQIVWDSLIFLIAPETKELSRMRDLAAWCRDYSKRCIVICSEANDMGDELSLKSGFLDNEYLSVMEYLIPFQIIAYLGARDLGLSTIHARNDGASKRLKTHLEE
ncbi:MAG: SIS domain-containing protein [Lachnospiraceae bacterium]|nr:SIS domain-containing protein [Lachnospiraceae bacterium]